eukprot:c19604_g1_i1.p1 GENE.c19604_g1_i1~~c19604_g1_i1.p1  ORF type:complete len:498 (-),score=136.75 c19604_g1_i1:149-1642(-)
MGSSSAVNEFLTLASSLVKIRVAVRMRPLNPKEKKKKETEALEMPGSGTLIVNENKVKVDLTKYVERHEFVFDECIDGNATAEEVYARTIRPMMAATFLKAKTTCFAYGQTGSGKTFTMAPQPLIAATDILRTLRTNDFCHLKVYVSVFEIYLSSVFDLLNERKRLIIRQDSSNTVHVLGLTEVEMTGIEILTNLLQIASKARSSAPTHANEQSSRSHQVLQVCLKDGENVHGKMSFIDLAGSEWGADIKDTNRQTRMEGAEINKSLLALKECIRALDREATHIPFRGSKLTEVLKDSFSGNSFTMMMACVSPASGSVEHSLNTLRYADRVRELQEPKDRTKPYVDRLTPGNDGVNRGTVMDSPDEVVWTRSHSQSFVRHESDERDLVAATATDEKLRMHDELIDTILEEEEEILNNHRTEIEETMRLVKEEMQLLDMMDRPGTQVDDYVTQLDLVLLNKIEVIETLRGRLRIFQAHLTQEDQMVKTYDNSYSRNIY